MRFSERAFFLPYEMRLRDAKADGSQAHKHRRRLFPATKRGPHSHLAYYAMSCQPIKCDGSAKEMSNPLSSSLLLAWDSTMSVAIIIPTRIRPSLQTGPRPCIPPSRLTILSTKHCTLPR